MFWPNQGSDKWRIHVLVKLFDELCLWCCRKKIKKFNSCNANIENFPTICQTFILWTNISEKTSFFRDILNCNIFRALFLCEGKHITFSISAWMYFLELSWKTGYILKVNYFLHERKIFLWYVDVCKSSLYMIHLMMFLMTSYFN